MLKQLIAIVAAMTLLVVGPLAATCSPVQAATVVTAGEMVEHCLDSPNKVDQTACKDYVRGYLDGLEAGHRRVSS
jgi:hypothetical protein